MPDKEPKGKQQSGDKQSPDTAEVAFDDIIDAILGADSTKIAETRKERIARKPPKKTAH